jgi:hypothetical protein
MPVGKGNKQASKGIAPASKKTARPSKRDEKQAGTRVSTIVNTRSAGQKKGGGVSRDKLRDGS